MMNMEDHSSIVELKFYGGPSHGGTVTIPSHLYHVNVVDHQFYGSEKLTTYRRYDLHTGSILISSGFSLFVDCRQLPPLRPEVGRSGLPPEGDRELRLYEWALWHTTRMLMETKAAGGWPVEWRFPDMIRHNRFFAPYVINTETPQIKGPLTYREIPFYTPPDLTDQIVLISVRPA